MADISDATLVARFRAGDARALEALLARYEAPLFQFLVGMLRDHHRAEDALQETFVRALERLDGVEPAGLRGWLFTVAYHEAMLARRRRKRRPALLPPPGQERPVVGHGEQPAAQVPRVHAVQPLQGADEGLLQDVLGLVVVAQHADEELEEVHLVAREKGVQGARVTAAKACEQGRVRGVRHACPALHLWMRQRSGLFDRGII